MKINDCHNDFFTEIKTNKEKHNYVENIKKHGVTYLSTSVFTTELANPMQTIRACKKFIQKQNDIKLLLHIEDLGFVSDCSLNEILVIRPFSVGLTWNVKNTFAGGAFSDEGFTKQGLLAVKKLEANNILIDTAHLNEKSFWQFVSITSKPIYNSHSCFFDVCNNKRNLKHNQLQKIVASGGFVGLTFVGKFLNDKNPATINDVIKHIKYFFENFGEDNIGFGSDFFGTSDLPKGLKHYGNFSAIEKQLVKNGFSVGQINKLFYKNFERFLKTNDLI